MVFVIIKLHWILEKIYESLLSHQKQIHGSSLIYIIIKRLIHIKPLPYMKPVAFQNTYLTDIYSPSINLYFILFESDVIYILVASSVEIKV